MSLEAKVRCTCWEHGRAAPFPGDPDDVDLDEAGWPALQVPAGHPDFSRKYPPFRAWLESCCPHEDMRLVSVRVGSWGTVSVFLQALERAGRERFPNLLSAIPRGDGGTLPSDLASQALDELRRLEAIDLGTGVFLADADSGHELREWNGAGGGLFFYGGGTGYDMGFDARGVFVVPRERGPDGSKGSTEIWRSMRFEQLSLDETHVKLRDDESGRTFVSPIPIEGAHGRPRRLQVVRRRVTAADYARTIEPLVELFEASVITGNPVVWG